MEKSALLKRLEKQDLIIYSVRKFLTVVDEKTQTKLRLLSVFLTAYSILFLFLFFYLSDIIKDPDFVFSMFMISIFAIFFFFLSLTSTYFSKRKKIHFEKYKKIKEEYILNNSNNLDILFEEISINGISNVSSRTSRNIIEKKRKQLLDGKDINTEDLLKETINLNKKEKEKEEIDLINY
jgi:hypothetical protein